MSAKKITYSPIFEKAVNIIYSCKSYCHLKACDIIIENLKNYLDEISIDELIRFRKQKKLVMDIKNCGIDKNSVLVKDEMDKIWKQKK
jgi:hypothetical protein